MKKIYLIIFISTLILFNKSMLNSLEVIQINDEKDNYLIGTYLEYYEDKSNSLTIDDIVKQEISDKFIKSNKDDLNFGFTDSSIWVRFKIKNNSKLNNSYIIELAYPFINIIELYFLDNKESYPVKKNGLDIPFNKRELKNKKFVFNIKINNSEEKQFYLRIKNDFQNLITINIYNDKYFYTIDSNENFILGIYYGMMLIILIINIIIYLFIREKNYLYFISFFILVVIMQLSLNQLIPQIFPNSIWFNNNILFPLGYLGLFFALIFTNDFFNTKSNFPKLNSLIFLLKLLIIINFILSFILEKSKITYLTTISLSIIMLILILIGFFSYLKKIHSALYFLLAWGLFIIGCILLALRAINLLPSNFITYYTFQIGSIFLVIFIPIALLDKFNLLKNEKELADKTIAEKDKDKFASIGMLLGGISHEIYNPLSGITGPLENIRKVLQSNEPDKIKLNKYLEYIDKNTQRIDNIIKNVRALYKKQELIKEKLDLNEIAESVLYYYRNISSKKIEFNIKINSNIEIYGDKDAVYQILNNLVSNAIDSIEEKGEISIILEKLNNEKIIKVIDNGTGINKEEVENIFNVFYTSKSVGTHVGLGLYIVKDLIIKLGWDIKVVSDSNGTSFNIIIKE